MSSNFIWHGMKICRPLRGHRQQKTRCLEHRQRVLFYS
ncbi:hypothetical protein RK21_04195 [Pseudomonas plecoglossicida]|nr:hypothetical protein RK21_04195 [Pseudomonas plecoglossicida]